MMAENPSLPEYPLNRYQDEQPCTLQVMDMIQFCWNVIGEPVRKGHHNFFDHHHLDYDIKAGRVELGKKIFECQSGRTFITVHTANALWCLMLVSSSFVIAASAASITVMTSCRFSMSDGS